MKNMRSWKISVFFMVLKTINTKEEFPEIEDARRLLEELS